MKHAWDVTLKEAFQIQKKIEGYVDLTPLTVPIKIIAGADVSFNKYEKDVYAGIIMLSYPDLIPIEHVCIKMEVTFPYVPGLLSFREIPPLLEVWKKIKHIPDVVMVDGHGIAHSRRLGIAAHFGLAINTPTLGAAKKKLYGIYDEPKSEKGSYAYLYDPKTQGVIGTVLRTKTNVKPMFISPGNQMSIDNARDIALKMVKGYRLPEPTRQAHLLVNAFRKGEIAAYKNYK